jgi:FkbM family methyltransferase
MNDLASALQGNFTFVNLGCIGDVDLPLPKSFRRMLTIVEADPEEGANTQHEYFRKVTVTRPVAGQAGKRQFRHTNFAGTCSLLAPKPGSSESFGMENYTRLLKLIEFDCTTIPDILRENNLPTLDFLKTDIEGLDSEIIKSCREFLGRTLFIQCELRFRPYYEGEPYFHETVNLLAEHGYEVLDLVHIDRWKYRTANRNYQLEGRAEWADFLFVLKPEALEEHFGKDIAPALAKQIILSAMMGKKNYGEFLLEKFQDKLPHDWREQLKPLLRPAFPNRHQIYTSMRRWFRPLELLLKHRIGKSEFVAIK